MNKSRGEVADLVRPLVDEQTRRTPLTDGESHGSEVSSAAPVAPVAKEAPAAETPSLASIRTLSLRIPAPSPLLPFEGGQWRPNEQYRILRTKISQCLAQPRVIVISSPASGDGKSVTAINTAGALSLKSEADVLLLDADLRKPVMHKQLGLPQSPGLADVLAGACTLEDALVHTKEFPNLYAIVFRHDVRESRRTAGQPAMAGRLHEAPRHVPLRDYRFAPGGGGRGLRPDPGRL